TGKRVVNEQRGAAGIADTAADPVAARRRAGAALGAIAGDRDVRGGDNSAIEERSARSGGSGNSAKRRYHTRGAVDVVAGECRVHNRQRTAIQNAAAEA